jgi:predicted lipoprotein with Yx(FWY)xxD motif
MKRRIFLASACLLAMISIMAGPARAQDSTFLQVAQDPALGAYLTDANGMTVYLFTPDTTADASACYDKCAENWPIVEATDDMTLPEGVPGELGSFERTDGITQATYNGIPLYLWVKDTAPGDTTGQNVGGVWFIVPPGAELGPYAPPPGEGTPAPATTPLLIGFTPELGPFLTDAAGMTLYLFSNDVVMDESTCYDKCEENWPIYTGENVTLPVGIQGTIAVIERTDGSTQVSYNGLPLYYFVKDVNAGDTTGQAVGDVWWIVAPGDAFGDDMAEDMGEDMGDDMGTPEA